MVGSDTRQRMIDAAIRLFRRSGYHATSWRGLVQEAGTPWGSAFHHFPGGKEELGRAAVDQAGQRGAQLIHAGFTFIQSPADAVQAWVKLSTDALVQSDFQDGCPVAGVTADMSASEPTLRESCGKAFTSWSDVMARALVAKGIPSARAKTLATFVVSSVEGALLLARASHSAEPLRIAGEELAALLDAACKASPGPVNKPADKPAKASSRRAAPKHAQRPRSKPG